LAFGRRLIQEHAALNLWRETNAHGNGAIRRDILKYDSMARNGVPAFVLTDLDARPCCRLLIDEWFSGQQGPHQDLLLRVCVREPEAWLMADPGPLSRLLRTAERNFPKYPETLPDPKQFLYNLTRTAPSKVRKGLLPAVGSTAKIGPEYNDLLLPLVSQLDIGKAAKRAPSLAKARQRLGELAARVAAGVM